MENSVKNLEAYIKFNVNQRISSLEQEVDFYNKTLGKEIEKINFLIEDQIEQENYIDLQFKVIWCTFILVTLLSIIAIVL